jgi:AraC-like DNA-binding protein
LIVLMRVTAPSTAVPHQDALSRAAGYLATTDHNLSTIARRTGYNSEASLSKAFKREYGTSPGGYRRHQAAQPIAIDSDDREAASLPAGVHQAAIRPGEGQADLIPQVLYRRLSRLIDDPATTRGRAGGLVAGLVGHRSRTQRSRWRGSGFPPR